ncbi:MAG: enoyl-CoA hydratase/isomerase family protein, partial [Betaproteobacteria bacterium]
MNSLSPSVLKAVDKALDEALEQADVMTVVLTGTGRAFCAGADLKYINDQLGDRGTSGFLESVQRTTNRLDRFHKPIIAALNGLTLAGGLE